MLLIVNLPIALAMVCGAYFWHWKSFQTPKFLSLSTRFAPRLVAGLGWIFITGILVKSIGGLFGDGRVQIRQSGDQYAHRTREPLLFYGEIAGELLMVGGIGALFVILARKRLQDIATAVNDQSNHVGG